jgi:serine protease Do
MTSALVLTALVGTGIGSALTFATRDANWSYAADARTAATAPPAEGLEHARGLSDAFKYAAQAIRPSVVSIRSTKVFKPAVRQRGEGGRAAPRPELPPEFRQFFGDDFFERFGAQPFGGEQFAIPGNPRPYRQEGQGTGVVITKDGYIVTNNHVVDGADEVEVTLWDDRSFSAKVIGTDAKTDIAVVKVEANDLVPAKVGDSDKIEVGDWVVASGSPFGLTQTVTSGIISAKGRSGVGIVEYEDFIQTDAAINPGNSGGPLVNLQGEVIGINTAIASRNGSFAGVGFSIPSNLVTKIMHSIIDDGKVERGWLGAAIQDLSKDLADSFGYDSTHGVLIGQVVPGSPAEKAGLKSGDIVVKFNGRQQKSANNFRNQVAGTKPNTSAKLEVMRDGKPVTLTVKIGTLEEKLTSHEEGADDVASQEEEGVTHLGMTVRNLTPDLAQQLKVGEGIQGVVVSDVEAGSLAEEAGLRAGVVVMSVNGQPVQNVAQFKAATSDDQVAKGVRLHIAAEGFQRFVFLKG